MVTKAYTTADKFIMGVDQALVTIFGKPQTTGRVYPAHDKQDDQLAEATRQGAAHLMRINYAGEICTQALYQSQAITARSKTIKRKMQQSMDQDNDHLDWCNKRLDELGSSKSYLNPLWYAGSFTIGTVAGLAGDRWNLGLIAETEKQAAQQLDNQLNQLSPDDKRSRAIVEQIKLDDGEHAAAALKAGGSTLPEPVQHGIQFMSRLIEKTTYWV